MDKFPSFISSALHLTNGSSPASNDWELIGTRINGDEGSDFVSDWLRSRISAIEKQGLGDDPNDLTCYVNGKTFQYMLVFGNSDGNPLGIYRTLKNSIAANKSIKKTGKPHWQLIGDQAIDGGSPSTGSLDNVPKWVLKYLYKHEQAIDVFMSEGTLRVHYLKGKRFRYKGYHVNAGHGRYATRVWRKPRMWYWKKLNAGGG